jgi:acetyl-CoA carboxylase carboxyltransferase component
VLDIDASRKAARFVRFCVLSAFRRDFRRRAGFLPGTNRNTAR